MTRLSRPCACFFLALFCALSYATIRDNKLNIPEESTEIRVRRRRRCDCRRSFLAFLAVTAIIAANRELKPRFSCPRGEIDDRTAFCSKRKENESRSFSPRLSLFFNDKQPASRFVKTAARVGGIDRSIDESCVGIARPRPLNS